MHECILRLKSDQDGIERSESLLVLALRSLQVEIRPRWDWKKAERRIQAVITEALKSDQDGIESSSSFIATGDSVIVKRWNQTKMGLKAFQYASMLFHLLPVEIRPRWDWKVTAPFTLR